MESVIKETEIEFGLVSGTIRKSTIKQRVERNNLTGVAHQRLSPLSEVEPIIVDYCIRLANMGAPLFWDQIVSLANSIIAGTQFKDALIKFKSKRNLLNTCCVSSESNLVGIAWYRGFIKRNSGKIVSKRGRVKDVKRHTWCVFDTFDAMYKHVYEKWWIQKLPEN